MKAFWIDLPRDVVPANLVRSVHCGKLVMVITHAGPAALAKDPIQFTTSAQTAKRCTRDERPASLAKSSTTVGTRNLRPSLNPARS